ncbi:MAG: GNAT family N-acetyltransferase [Arachidicoccus sp.]|nr:GNAT family N-acetyltransferase [Arachidicoccus sp.]
MITYTAANSPADLYGILELQKANLSSNLSPEEIQSQGFVTVIHTFEQLSKLNNVEKHIIAKSGDKVIAYILAMTQAASSDIPVLVPMFNEFNKINYKNNLIKDYDYIVVGQTCVDKEFRGQGIFDKCYDAYRNTYHKKYDFAITDIVKINARSLQAHKRKGFKEIKTFTADNTEWVIVLWDWKENS